MEVFLRLQRLLTEGERKRIRGVMALAVIAGVFQTLAVISIMPFMALVSDPERGSETSLAVWMRSTWGLEDPRELLMVAGFGVLFLVVVANLMASLSLRRVHLTAWNINHYLSHRVLTAYFRRPYLWFLERHSGGLSRNLLEEVRRVVQGALIPLMTAGVRGVEALLLVLLLLFVDLRLTLAAGGLLGGFYLIVYFLVRVLQRRLGEIRSKATRLRFQVVTEALGGIKEVKALGAEEEFLRRFGDTGPAFVRSEAWSQVFAELPRHLLEVLSFGAVLGLLLFFVLSGSSLDEAIPVLALFGFAGYKLVPSFHQVFTGVSLANFALISLKEIEADLEAEGEETAFRARRVKPLRITQGIELVDVTLRYPKAKAPALDRISLTITKGMRVGIVGPTGAGKTTFVDVLLGLLLPEDGEFRVDGKVLSGEDRDAWRAGVGYVPQSIFLTEDTIAQNIAFGVPEEEVDLDRVFRAAGLAALDSFIEELPHGYGTRVGERGVRLSGGQRQRIGIARALYRDPSLLLLDEATSSLDGVTEEAVMEAIFGLAQEQTVVIVAHRLATIRRCECIFLLEGGRLVDEGTFDHLSETNDLFRGMARTQGI